MHLQRNMHIECAVAVLCRAEEDGGNSVLQPELRAFEKLQFVADNDAQLALALAVIVLRQKGHDMTTRACGCVAGDDPLGMIDVQGIRQVFRRETNRAAASRRDPADDRTARAHTIDFLTVDRRGRSDSLRMIKVASSKSSPKPAPVSRS